MSGFVTDMTRDVYVVFMLIVNS